MAVWNFEPQMRNVGVFPDILALGDSWFWYPENNLLNPIDKLCAGTNTLCLGANGAESVQLAAHRYREYFRAYLKTFDTIKVVLLSAGGNDFAGLDDFADLLNQDCSQCQNPADCFRQAEPGNLFDAVIKSYRTLIADVVELRPDAKVLVHSYDYAIPDGRSFHGISGQWLKIPMNNCHVPMPGDLSTDSFRRQLVKLLIDDMTTHLSALEKDNPGRVIRVNTPGTLTDDQWSNELHPTFGGFAKLAATRFAPLIKPLLLV
ncbi:hypothetical protein P3W85_17660 [Cupriavidus basilensis]|uniref:SGNH/GDSL hydrolase family protein n=1 Tax=Cupriavidus basilensis TaxID=68895 RepID=A0ABT6AQ73_9BURK|nr:hypothetical protein [Cupriavidus basilensis]MDF3834770.1 hypothetical protein [Cupriavidus basilensis]